MTEPPISAEEFDYTNPGQLRAMLFWAGSGRKLELWCKKHGIEVTASRLNYYRELYGIPIPDPRYRRRSERMQQAPAIPSPPSDSTAAQELLEYLKNRTVPTGRPPVTKPTDGRYVREMIGFDLHAPLHHEAAWELFLAVIDKVKPEGVTLGGDVLDLAQISRFVKKPSAMRQLQTDLDWAREHVFARINAVAPDATRTMVLGNHEGERWERYLWERCPEIAELRCLRMEVLLGLDELGWQFEPDGYELIPGVFVIEHGDRHTNALGGGSAMSARKEMIDQGISGCSGHTHRLGAFWRLDNAGYRVWYEGGCLCDQFKMREHRVTTRKRGRKLEDWHLGFLIVYYSSQGQSFFVEAVPILQNKRRTFCIVQGEEVTV